MKGLGEQDTYLVNKKRQVKSNQAAKGIAIGRGPNHNMGRNFTPGASSQGDPTDEDDPDGSISMTYGQEPSETESNLIMESEEEPQFAASFE